MKKSDIINPKHPNKATKIFEGKSSGILNWNDLKHSHFYLLREKIRATFFAAAEIDLTKDTPTPDTADVISRLIFSTASLRKVLPFVADGSTDPSVTSIFATMLDQQYEHLHALQGALQEYGLELQRKPYIIDTGAFSDVLDGIAAIVESKQEPIPQVSQKGLGQLLALIKTDRLNHVEFLKEIGRITAKERGLPLPAILGETSVPAAAEDDFDEFDDL